MAVNYNLGSRLSSPKGGTSQQQLQNTTFTFGRVTDIVMDAFHPLYDKKGKGAALYGVEYVDATKTADLSEEGGRLFAYCGSTNIKKLPLKNELVLIINGPSWKYRKAGIKPTTKYWIDIVPIWNHIHHNAYPDVAQAGEGDVDLGDDFSEQSERNNLQLFPGDISIESRHGSSLRFSGTKFASNEISDKSNNMSPFTILRNGQIETEDGLDAILENINDDASSIYLTSDHSVELSQANEKRDALENEPDKADAYKGMQVLINSGRLFFNAKEEGAFISATEQIGLNAKEIGLDADDYIGLDSKKIYLGKVAFKEVEPVMKGQVSIDWLDDFLSKFESLVKGMATMPPAPPAAIAKMIATSNSILPLIPVLKQQLNQLLSKKVYTE